MNKKYNVSIATKISATMIAVLLGLCASPLNAAMIISDDFSIGYGFNNGTWNTTETSGVNIGPGANFNLNIAMLGSVFSNTGPKFTNRILTGPLAATTSNQIMQLLTFGTTLTGAYTGPTPLDAAAIPNYQITLNITTISIYIAPSTVAAGQSASFRETTVGNVQAQSPQALPSTGSFASSLSSYLNDQWDPTDFQSSGTSQARKFALNADSAVTALGADGFQVFGNIVLTYDAIPEPSSLWLVAPAFLGVIVFRCRRAKQLA